MIIILTFLNLFLEYLQKTIEVAVLRISLIDNWMNLLQTHKRLSHNPKISHKNLWISIGLHIIMAINAFGYNVKAIVAC
jgi:hypothetical protein